MGIKQVRISDLTGNELADEDVVSVICREADKRFDASLAELADLKRVTNVVELEFRHPDGKTETVLVSRGDFNKVITPEVLDKADSIRGRRTGFKPNGSA